VAQSPSADVIGYLNEENQMLNAELRDRKVQLTDVERCRSATHAKALAENR
jgi:hypothetical protein